MLLLTVVSISKKTGFILGVIGLIIVGVIVFAVTRPSSESVSNDGNSETPTYKTVLPNGKTVSDLGGWQRVSPPEAEPVFAYTDTVGGILVNVSQQPLPDSFASDISGEVAKLAKSYNASTQVDANSTKVYIGTSAKGPQSVIFTKDSLLILIKSREKIDDESWITYVTSLN